MASDRFHPSITSLVMIAMVFLVAIMIPLVTARNQPQLPVQRPRFVVEGLLDDRFYPNTTVDEIWFVIRNEGETIDEDFTIETRISDHRQSSSGVYVYRVESEGIVQPNGRIFIPLYPDFVYPDEGNHTVLLETNVIMQGQRYRMRTHESIFVRADWIEAAWTNIQIHYSSRTDSFATLDEAILLENATSFDATVTFTERSPLHRRYLVMRSAEPQEYTMRELQDTSPVAVSIVFSNASSLLLRVQGLDADSYFHQDVQWLWQRDDP